MLETENTEVELQLSTKNVVQVTFSENVSFYSKFFKARLHIGYLAYPYIFLGFFLHWSLLSFDLDEFTQLSTGAWWRFIFASLIAFLYMPYVFIINDFFDAPYDALDVKKRRRNPFCQENLRKRKLLNLFLILPGLLSFLLALAISWQTGIITLIALFLGTFYSARPFRFKETPFLDFVVHGICLGVYFYALGYFTFWRANYDAFTEPIFLLLLIFAFIDGAWIQFDSQIIDYFTDKAGHQKTSAVYLGPKKTLQILKIMLSILLIMPAGFILVNNNLLRKLGLEFSLLIAVLLLLLPISYLHVVRGGEEKMEQIRNISSHYRVYSVYIMSVAFVLLANPLFYV